VEFVETSTFSKEVDDLLSDEEYRGLQLALVFDRNREVLFPKYYWITKEDKIYMLMLYGKSDQEDLTPAQARILKKLVVEELDEGR